MSSFGRIVVTGIAGAVLIGFFVWVLLQMAWASDSQYRLVKLAIGFSAATGGAGIIYLMTAPLGRRRR